MARIVIPLLLLACAACTEPNPGYEGERDGGTACTPGARTCSGQSVMVCVPKAGGATGYELERACPPSSTCKAGICAPGAGACVGSCDPGLVCTVFVNPATMNSLGNYCAKPVGSKVGTMSCAKDSDCSSGFCISRAGKAPTCYQPCGKNRSCPPPTKCVELTLTVNGIQGTIPGCMY